MLLFWVLFFLKPLVVFLSGVEQFRKVIFLNFIYAGTVRYSGVCIYFQVFWIYLFDNSLWLTCYYLLTLVYQLVCIFLLLLPPPPPPPPPLLLLLLIIIIIIIIEWEHVYWSGRSSVLIRISQESRHIDSQVITFANKVANPSHADSVTR